MSEEWMDVPDPQALIEEASILFSVNTDDIQGGSSKRRPVAAARWVAEKMRAVKFPDGTHFFTLEEIGEWLHRHHSSVHHILYGQREKYEPRKGAKRSRRKR